MKTKIILPFILISLFLLTACEEQTKAPTGKAFIGGTDGLTFAFEPISVKEEGLYSVFDNEEFPLEITIKNKGEETIKPNDITLALLGPAQEDFTGIPSWEKKNSDELEKISEFNPDGGEETVSFAQKAKYKEKVIGAQDITWNLNYQYKYKTYLIIDDVCFKEDPQDTRVCNVEETKSFSVSNAPVTVTAVKEDTAGKGLIALTIEVKNAGGGEITSLNEEFDPRFDLIDFKIDEPNKWECKSGGKESQARFEKQAGTATIRCKLKQPLKEGELYSSSVKLTLEYVYQNLIKETLRIKESQK